MAKRKHIFSTIIHALPHARDPVGVEVNRGVKTITVLALNKHGNKLH
jgi:hypothetical protein